MKWGLLSALTPGRERSELLGIHASADAQLDGGDPGAPFSPRRPSLSRGRTRRPLRGHPALHLCIYQVFCRGYAMQLGYPRILTVVGADVLKN